MIYESEYLSEQDYLNIQKKLSYILKIERISKGISLMTLSEMSKLSKNYLSKIENGEIKSPSLKTYLRICYALRINPLKLFEDINKYPPFSDDDYFFID